MHVTDFLKEKNKNDIENWKILKTLFKIFKIVIEVASYQLTLPGHGEKPFILAQTGSPTLNLWTVILDIPASEIIFLFQYK